MAKSQAQKDAEAAEAASQEQKALLGENLELQPTGVVLDTTDPNYEQLKRLEDLRGQVAEAQSKATDTGQSVQADVRKAQLDAEESRLKAELAAAQQAANEENATAAVANVFDQLQARADADAAVTNNQSGS